MKIRTIILGALGLAAAVAGLGWWLMRPDSAATPKLAEIPSVNLAAVKPTDQPVTHSLPPPAPVEAPPAPVVETPPAPPVDNTTVTIVSPPNPQADLKTAVPDLLKELQDQDYASFFQNYLAPSITEAVKEREAQLPDDLPPEQRAAIQQQMEQFLTQATPQAAGQQMAQQMANNPQAQQRMQTFMDALSSIQDATPQYDATGTSASYPLANPTPGLPAIAFKQINGQWVLDAAAMRGFSGQ